MYKTDEQWQREDDARTLARAEEIKADKVRHAGAIQAATAMVQESQKEVSSMAKVAGKSAASKVPGSGVDKSNIQDSGVVELLGKIK